MQRNRKKLKSNWQHKRSNKQSEPRELLFEPRYCDEDSMLFTLSDLAAGFRSSAHILLRSM